MSDLGLYYAKDGSPIDHVMEWAAEREQQMRVAETTVGEYWISTVYLGIDLGFGQGPPLIFETMIFRNTANDDGLGDDMYQDRYATEEQAIAGHAAVVEAVEKGDLP